MTIKVNPNRMELLKLKRRAEVAKRGHKLLKDKFDELMRRFLALLHEEEDLRKKIEEKLSAASEVFALARGEVPVEVVEEALLSPQAKVDVEISTKMLMNVAIPQFEPTIEKVAAGYSLAKTPALLDDALDAFEEALPLLIKLAELEKGIELLAAEIERTRRRVNALEYILIPQLDEAIRFITMKLDELERADRTRLMKIKEIVSESAI